MLEIKWRSIKDAFNIIFLDDNAKEISQSEFEEDLQTGYRAGMLIIPMTNAIQLQIAMMTPYHKDHYEIDPGFIVDNYNQFLINCDDAECALDTEEDEFYIGEIEID